MKPSLVPLSCAACGGAVPLVAGDRTVCPSSNDVLHPIPLVLVA